MFRALLTMLGALVLLLGFGSNASAATNLPPECVKTAEIGRMLDTLKGKDKLYEYSCVDNANYTWKVTVRHVSYALTQMAPFQNFVVSKAYNLNSCNVEPIVRPAWSKVGYSTYYNNQMIMLWSYYCGKPRPGGGSTEWIGGNGGGYVDTGDSNTYINTTNSHYASANAFLECIKDAAEAYKCANTDFPREFPTRVSEAAAQNLTATIPGFEGNPVDDGTGTEPGTGTTPGTGGTSTPTTCTTSGGATTTNQYECAPSDTETKCSVLDIPCNLKKLFIPDKNFITNKIKNSSFGVNVNLPVSVVQEWTETLKVGPFTLPVGISFKGLELSEKGKDQWRFMIFWGTFLWLLHFLGIPFLGTRQQVGTAGRDAGNASGGVLSETGNAMADSINKGANK